jgi:hypothetical protein
MIDALLTVEEEGVPLDFKFVREPENEHDANAIAIHVVVGRNRDGDESRRVGYVPRDEAVALAPRLDRGENPVVTGSLLGETVYYMFPSGRELLIHERILSNTQTT